VNKEEGVTVLLTTHYMDEADQNSDTICIIDKGKIIANGTPEELKKSLKQDRIQLQTDNDDKATQIIKDLPGISQIKGTPNGLTIHLDENASLMTKLVDLLRSAGVQIDGITLLKPTLDDVFIQYTGRELNENNQEISGM
jgi:ABC-2 type transport system ATP-binding protein